jgi:hypothetical protein
LCDPISIGLAELSHKRQHVAFELLNRPAHLARQPFSVIWDPAFWALPYQHEQQEIAPVLSIGQVPAVPEIGVCE